MGIWPGLEKMIISEKQIMQLIMCARSYLDVLKNNGDRHKDACVNLAKLIHEITYQQSEELKVIE